MQSSWKNHCVALSIQLYWEWLKMCTSELLAVSFRNAVNCKNHCVGKCNLVITWMHTTLQKLTDVATCYSALHRYAVIHLQALLVTMFHVCIDASLHNPLMFCLPVGLKIMIYALFWCRHVGSFATLWFGFDVEPCVMQLDDFLNMIYQYTTDTVLFHIHLPLIYHL